VGRTIPTAGNVIKSFQTANKLKLDQGEKARVMLAEYKPATEDAQDVGPMSEFVYDIRIPDQREGDRVTQEGKWFGTFIAPGDPAKLEEFGWDDAILPADCIEFIRNAPDMFRVSRKHATNVVLYTLKPGSFELAHPSSCQHKVWVFGEGMFKTLSGIYDTYKDLRRYDILLTCENKQFQRFQVMPAPDAAWLTPAYNPGGGEQPGDLKMLVLETFREQKMTDEQLSSAIAPKVSVMTLAEKMRECAREAGLVGGASNGGPAVAATPEEISGMLAGTPAPTPELDPAPATPPPAAPETATSANESPAEPDPVPGPAPTIDMQSVLGDL
jgi:hypothetical protein